MLGDVMKNKIFIITVIAFQISALFGQTRTVGLFLNDTTKAFKGIRCLPPSKIQ